MAIEYIKDIDTSKYIFTHNNSIIEYTSNTTSSIRSEININGETITLYPSPQGIYYFNFKDYITSLINSNNYTDDLLTDLSTTFVYDWTPRVFLSLDIDVTITLTNDDVENDLRTYDFYLSAANLFDFNTKKIIRPESNLPYLGMQSTSGYNNYYCKYWTGYPFDILTHADNAETFDLIITNNTNLTEYEVSVADTGRFVRVAFSDGRTDNTIENVVPFVNGINKLSISTDLSGFSYLRLEKVTGCEGTYLKWLNKNGGYSYWLFVDNSRQRRTKQLGYLNNDYNNLEDTISEKVSLGISSNDTLTVSETLLREEEKNLLMSVIDSPKVYLFTGVPFSQNTFNDWMEIKIEQRRTVLKQVKRDLYNIDLSFSLHENNNITL